MAAASNTRSSPRPARIRWDRVGRVTMLVVLVALLYLAISPIRSLIGEVHLAAQRGAQLHQLQRTARQLASEIHALSTASTANAEARNLGYVRPGEHEWVISGLPGD